MTVRVSTYRDNILPGVAIVGEAAARFNPAENKLLPLAVVKVQ